MTTTRCLGVLFVAGAAASLGCSGQTPHASSPAAAAAPSALPVARGLGQTEMQALAPPSTEPSAPTGPTAPSTEESPLPPLPPPAPDAIVAVRPDGSPVTAVQIGQPAGKVPVPSAASLTASVTVTEVRSFPEETTEEVLAEGGLARAYQTSQTYQDTVRSFDRSLATAGFQVSSRAVTARATVWALRGPGGEHSHVAVRDTKPTTFEIVEAASGASASR